MVQVVSQELKIKGGKKKQRDLTEKIVKFAIKNLFPKVKKYNIKIRLNNKNNCFEWEDRIYEINIDKKQEEDDFITAIFHELVHVKQYIRKEPMERVKFPITWEEYINLPEEKEAFKLQEELFLKWKHKNNYK